MTDIVLILGEVFECISLYWFGQNVAYW